MSIPSLKELCIKQISETAKTEILINRNSHLTLYWKLVSEEFFKSWHKTSRNIIDMSLINGLDDSAIDIIYKWRQCSPNLYRLVIEREFWDTFFLF